MSDQTKTITIPAEMTPELLTILGRPNFTCRNIANVLRANGQNIATKAEEEQAHTILYLLGHYAEGGDDWKEKTNKALAALAQKAIDKLDDK